MVSRKQKQFWKRRLKRLTKKVHLLIVPSRENHYRPHMVRRYGLLAIVVIAVGIQSGYNYTHTGSVLGRVTTVTPAGLLVSTNDQRTRSGLGTLQLDARLSEAATAKARDMLRQGYWDHTAPDGTEPWVWIDDSGYTYQQAGENLAKNFSTASAAVSAWMDSPSHRSNMLGDAYKDVGFGVVNGELNGSPTSVIVAFYAAPVRQEVAGVATARTAHSADSDAPLTLASRIGIAIQSLTPAAITSLALIFIAMTVAVTAHFYRSKLPIQRRESWYKHHGAVKASGLLVIAAFIVLLYGGGQI